MADERSMSKAGRLCRILRSVDPQAEQLLNDRSCEWVRSRIGIVGLVALRDRVSTEAVERDIRHLVDHAYAAIDTLPSSTLSFEDLWALLLLVEIPWSRAEVEASQQLSDVCARLGRDTVGSRKIVVFAAESILELFGPLGTGPSNWMPSSGDPIHETLDAIAYDNVEREALEILFRRRISEDDIDTLIRVLARHHPK